MRINDIILEKAAAKPRNFVAKNAMKTTSGAGKHKDKKKAQKQGETKHKGKIDEVIAFSPGYGGKSPYNRSGTARKKTSSMLDIMQSINKKEQEKKAEKETKVKEISDWGEPEELLADVMSALERQVEWPLNDVMDRQEVQNLLQPVRNAINAKMKNIGQGVSESLRTGEYHVATVTLDDGTVKKVKVFSDEGFRDRIQQTFAKQGQRVKDIKMDYGVHQVGETASQGSMSSGDFSVGAVYKNKKGRTYKNPDGTAKNALDVKGANLLTGGSIAKR